MKNLLILLLLLLLVGCSTYSKNKGVRYLDDAPNLLLSVAPTFKNPYEIELRNHKLKCYIYSGMGGYSWGSRSKAFEGDLDKLQIEEVKQLAANAVIDAPLYEDLVFLDGTNWYLQFYFGQYRVITANSPEADSTNRGYSSLVDLGKVLRDFCGFGSST